VAIAALFFARPAAAQGQDSCSVIIVGTGLYKMTVNTNGPYTIVDFDKGTGFLVPAEKPIKSSNGAGCRNRLNASDRITVTKSRNAESYYFFQIANEIAGKLLDDGGAHANLYDDYSDMQKLAKKITGETFLNGVEAAAAAGVKQLIKKYANPSGLFTDKGAQFVVDLAVQMMVEQYVEGKDPGLIIDGVLNKLVDKLKDQAGMLTKSIGGDKLNQALNQALKPNLDKMAKDIKALLTEKLPEEEDVRADASTDKCSWSLAISYSPRSGSYRAVYNQLCGPQRDRIARLLITSPKNLNPGDTGQVTVQAISQLGTPFPLASATIDGLAAVMADGSVEPTATIAGNTATFKFTVAKPRHDQGYPIHLKVVTDKSVGALTGVGDDSVEVVNVAPVVKSVTASGASARPGEPMNLKVQVVVTDDNADKNHYDSEVPIVKLAIKHPGLNPEGNPLKTMLLFNLFDSKKIPDAAVDRTSGSYLFEATRSVTVARPHPHGTWSATISIADDNDATATASVELEVKDVAPSVTLLTVSPRFVHNHDGVVIDAVARFEDPNGVTDIVTGFIDATAAGGQKYMLGAGLIKTASHDEYMDVHIVTPFPHVNDEGQYPVLAEVRDSKSAGTASNFVHVGNLPPVIDAGGYVYDTPHIETPDAPRHVCPNQTFRVGMGVSDPEGDPLRVMVTIAETREQVELTKIKDNFYAAAMIAPSKPGTYTLVFGAVEQTIAAASAHEMRLPLIVDPCAQDSQSNDRLLSALPDLKTGLVNLVFQNIIIESVRRAFDHSHLWGGAGGTGGFGLLGLLFVRPADVAMSHAPVWSTRGPRIGEPAPLRVSASSSGSAPSGLEVALIATGNSTGRVFRLQALNGGSLPISVSAPDGLVLQPIKQAARSAVEKLDSKIPGADITGYCLDFGKLPPTSGTLYRVADEQMQQRFAPLAGVLRAERKLAAAGLLHPDSDPAAYGESIRQWALWSRIEHFDLKDFEQHFIQYTRKNLEGAGQKWSGDLERGVRQLAGNRWQDITAVWSEADRLAGSSGTDASAH
jgi:hypothetical protein